MPCLAALQMQLALSDAELKKILLGRLTFLGISIEENVMPFLAALQK